MTDALLYGLSAMLVFFTIGTFVLSRIKTDEYPEDYEFKRDPFWYVLGLLFIAGIVLFVLLPDGFDTVNHYGYADFIIPFCCAVLLYVSYLLDISPLTWLLTVSCSFGMTFLLPNDFQLLPPSVSPLLDRIAVTALLVTVSKGLGLLNGLGAIASVQFSTVMIVSAVLAYVGILPQLLGAVALGYAGVMLAFAFLSWPPEKIVMSDGGFASIGFILGCFMLNASAEFSEASMFIAASYLFTEAGIVIYERFIKGVREDYFFMNTFYYRIFQKGLPENLIVRGILKIAFIDALLALMQVISYERVALPVFSVALNVWFLSILSGDTKPEELISFSNLGKKAVKGIIGKKDKAKNKNKQKNN